MYRIRAVLEGTLTSLPEHVDRPVRGNIDILDENCRKHQAQRCYPVRQALNTATPHGREQRTEQCDDQYEEMKIFTIVHILLPRH